MVVYDNKAQNTIFFTGVYDNLGTKIWEGVCGGVDVTCPIPWVRDALARPTLADRRNTKSLLHLWG